MEKTLAFALCAAVGAAASAHPFGEKWPASMNPGTPGPIVGVDAGDPLNDSFECYMPGEGLSDRGGWETWDGTGLDALISDAGGASGSNSASFGVTAIDVVHQFSGYTSGQFTYSAMTYMSSIAVDIVYYMIALNQYDGTGVGYNWSVQCQFDSFLGEVSTDSTFASGPGFASLVFDQWVEWRAEVDLDANTYDLYYDGVLYAGGNSWTDGVSGGGIKNLAAIDLYTDFAGSTGFFLDDVVVKEAGTSPGDTCGGGGGCYADCDGSGTLDFFDFLCFQNAFALGEPYADCDGTGVLDFFDFLCFQNEFAMGCP